MRFSPVDGTALVALAAALGGGVAIAQERWERTIVDVQHTRVRGPDRPDNRRGICQPGRRDARLTP